jgi:xeroderma pigmentosum group C-complementing protein
MQGSRDFGAQLFTALLRALGAETRLIFSLQPLGFNFGKAEDAHRLDRRKDDLNKAISDSETVMPPKKRKRGGHDESDDDLGLPKVKSKGTSEKVLMVEKGPDSDLKYPIFWSEVYVEDKWIPLDALVLQITATTPKDIEPFEPKGKVAEDKKLVMGYVIAYNSGTRLPQMLIRTLCQGCHCPVCQELPRQGQKMENS